MNRLTIFAAMLLLTFNACKKGDDKGSSYNGFKVDGVVYQMDSIEHSFDFTRRPLMIHSADNGGAVIYFHVYGNELPSADGAYQYKLKAVLHDSLDAKACFSPDDPLVAEYCSIEGAGGQSLSTLLITISGGKWSMSLPATTIYDNSAKMLEIQAHE